VRGDSRLDLYAKSLAVLLLGLLGLAGALVDYWPAPMSLPITAHPSTVPLTPSVQTAFEVPGFVAPPVELVRLEVTAPIRAAKATAPIDRKLAASETAPQVAEIGPASPVQTLGESLPNVLIEPELTTLQAPPTEFSTSVEFAVVDPSSRLSPALGAAAEPADDGLFSGMLKKTGSSVSSSLGKASNSLMGAVRVVGDAVKKAF
jgi:hypothetical protein